jgi:WD40 repeat protein
MRTVWTWCMVIFLVPTLLAAQDVDAVSGGFTELRTPHPDGTVGMAFSPDGRYLVAAGEDSTTGKGQVTIWKIAGGEVVYRRADFLPYCGFVDVSPDGSLIAVTCLAGPVYVLRQEQPRDFTKWLVEARLLRPEQSRNHKFTLASIRFSPSGRQLATLIQPSHTNLDAPTDLSVHLYSCSNFKTPTEVLPALPLRASGIRFLGGDERVLVSAAEPTLGQGEMIVLDTASKRVVDAFYPNEQLHAGQQAHLSVGSFDVSPDGRHIAVSGRGYLRTFAADSFQQVHDLPLPAMRDASEVCFSPDSSRLAAINDNRIKLWDVKTGETIGEGSTQRSIQRLAYSPDGELLAASYAGGPIRLWSVESLVGE